MQQIDPDQIARAGALARWGTLLNAATALVNAMNVEQPGRGVRGPIEENRRRSMYSARLTELHDLAGYPREWWER